MKKAKENKPGSGLVQKGETDKLVIARRKGESPGRALARVTLDPTTRHASLAGSFANQLFDDTQQSSIMENAAVLGDEVDRMSKGDMAMTSRILASQAMSLDALFTEMARRSGLHMGEYPQAMERYMRLALKAQSASRATLEALARLHQPREQTVKHVHVNQGGQAVVADQFHHHQRGAEENGKSDNQSHATAESGECATLPCPDPRRDGMPIASGEGKEEVPDARREKSRRTQGQP